MTSSNYNGKRTPNSTPNPQHSIIEYRRQYSVPITVEDTLLRVKRPSVKINQVGSCGKVNKFISATLYKSELNKQKQDGKLSKY
jgi:hypothetical protein